MKTRSIIMKPRRKSRLKSQKSKRKRPKLLKKWKSVLFFLFRIFQDWPPEDWIHSSCHRPQSHLRFPLALHRYPLRAHRRQVGLLDLPKTTAADPHRQRRKRLHRINLQHPPPQGLLSLHRPQWRYLQQEDPQRSEGRIQLHWCDWQGGIEGEDDQY